MAVPLLRLFPVTEAWLLYRRAEGPALSLHLNGLIAWMVDGSMIDEVALDVLLDRLGDVGTQASAILTPRDVPGEEVTAADQWGEFHFVGEDIYPDEITWKVDPSGFWIPAPRKLVRPRLLRQASAIGTMSMAFFNPPDPAVYMQE